MLVEQLCPAFGPKTRNIDCRSGALERCARSPHTQFGEYCLCLMRHIWGALVRRACAGHLSPLVPGFAPTSPNNLEYFLAVAVSKNLAHPLHPVNDDGKGGGCQWWE